MLHWTQEEFWRATPGLLFGLMEVHNRAYQGAEEQEQTQTVRYYDDLPAGFW